MKNNEKLVTWVYQISSIGGSRKVRGQWSKTKLYIRSQFMGSKIHLHTQVFIQPYAVTTMHVCIYVGKYLLIWTSDRFYQWTMANRNKLVQVAFLFEEKFNLNQLIIISKRFSMLSYKTPPPPIQANLQWQIFLTNTIN